MVTTESTVEQNGTAPDDQLASLYQDGVIVALNIHFWRAQRKLRPSDLNLDPDEVPDIFSLGRKLMVPREKIRKFSRLESTARTHLERYSFAFPLVAGAHFIPYTAFGDFNAGMKDLKAEFGRLVTNFMRGYAASQRQMLRRYPDQAHALEGYYPSADVVRAKFGWNVLTFEMRLPSKLKPHLVTARKASDMAREATDRQAANAQAVAQYRDEVRERMSDWIEEAAGALRQETVRVCQNVLEAVKDGKLRGAHGQSVKKWADRFEALNFLDDRAMATAIAEVRSQFDTSVQDINSNEAALGAVQQAAEAAVKEAERRGGLTTAARRYRRRIQWD